MTNPLCSRFAVLLLAVAPVGCDMSDSTPIGGGAGGAPVPVCAGSASTTAGTVSTTGGAGSNSSAGASASTGGGGAAGALGGGGSAGSAGGAAGPLKVCERPESAYFDATTNAWYVSCQGKTDPDDGFVSKLNAEGSAVVTEKLVTGLDEPKGIRIHDGKLYVSNVTELVTASVETGAVLATTPVAGIDSDVPEAPFLNDVEVDDETGVVYVSDNRNNALFSFDQHGGSAKLLVKDAALEAPNGLLIDKRATSNVRLLIAAMGPGLNPMRGVTDKLGAVLAVDLADLNDGDKKVTVTYVTARIGNLDGIELDGNDLIVSDFFAGRVMRVPDTSQLPTITTGYGDAKILRQTLLRSGDLGVDGARRLVLVPETNNNALVALDLSTL